MYGATFGDDQSAQRDEVMDAAGLAHFEALIEQDSRIEPRDWMPLAYRQTMIRQRSSGSSPRATS